MKELLERLYTELRYYGPNDKFNKEFYLTLTENIIKELQPHGTWRAETDEEEPNPMFKWVVCSACNGKSNTTYKFCPNCGADMLNETKPRIYIQRSERSVNWEPIKSPLHTGDHSQ